MKKVYIAPSMVLFKGVGNYTLLAGSNENYQVMNEDYNDETMTVLGRQSNSLWDDEDE